MSDTELQPVKKRKVKTIWFGVYEIEKFQKSQSVIAHLKKRSLSDYLVTVICFGKQNVTKVAYALLTVHSQPSTTTKTEQNQEEIEN